eukprot:3299096-Ditylum_brightwellii.AAC.1
MTDDALGVIADNVWMKISLFEPKDWIWAMSGQKSVMIWDTMTDDTLGEGVYIDNGIMQW